MEGAGKKYGGDVQEYTLNHLSTTLDIHFINPLLSLQINDLEDVLVKLLKKMREMIDPHY